MVNQDIIGLAVNALRNANVDPSNYLYVAKSGSDLTGDGSAGKPYLTVQNAIDNASSGTTLFIYPGTYTENLTLKAGVNLTTSAKYNTYIVGTVTADFTGTIFAEKIIFKSATGTVLDFKGTGVQNFQCAMCNFESTGTNANSAINWTNSNASSKISLSDGVVTAYSSASGARAFTSSSIAAGSLIASNTTFQVLDNLDNICINLAGSLVFTHTLDAINGQVVTANTARFLITLVSLTTNTVPVLVHNSTNTTSSVASSVVVTTTASPVITGIGAFAHVAIMYGGTGAGGSSTINGGLGPIGLPMGSVKLRSSSLVPANQISLGYNTGAFEFTGSDLYHTINTNRYKMSIYPEVYASHTLYVDNSRTDTYTPDGSESKPYTDVQSAHNAIGGTNYLTVNQNSVETDLTGFAAKLSATLSRDTTEYRFGSASLKIVTPGTVSGEGVTLTGSTVTASVSYTAEVWVKGSGTVTLALQEQTSGGVVVGTTTKAITLSSVWTRYEIARTFGTTGVSAVVLLYTSSTQAITFYADGFRVGLTSLVPSITNTYGISVALGIRYTGTLDIWRDYLTIYGQGATKGAGFKGTINNWSPHLTIYGVHLVGTSSATRDCYFNQTMNGDYLLEFKECRLSYCTMNVSSTGTTAQKNNSYIQITGDSNLWQNNTINITGINGFAGMTGGAYVSNTVTVTDSYFCPGCSCVDSCTVNLESGSTSEFFSMYAVRNTTNLKTGATLYADITALADMSNTFNNTGGTLIRVSDPQVRTTVLTGLSTSTSAAITETDTILEALGKLQAQINAL